LQIYDDIAIRIPNRLSPRHKVAVWRHAFKCSVAHRVLNHLAIKVAAAARHKARIKAHKARSGRRKAHSTQSPQAVGRDIVTIPVSSVPGELPLGPRKTGRIAHRDRVVATVTVEIGCIAVESAWISLQKSATIRRVIPVSQII